MAGTTAAPWSIGFPESTDEVKVYPAEGKAIAERISTIFGGKIPTITKHAASYEAKSGELGEVTKTAQTVTLPLAATVDQLIGIFSTVAEAKVTTSGGAEVLGDFTASATFKLTTNQHVILQSNGTNWFILSGEPMRERKYKAQVVRAVNTEYEPSATRSVSVIIEVNPEAGFTSTVSVGGVQVGVLASSGSRCLLSFICNPKEKWKLSTGNTVVLSSSYKIL